MTSCHVSTSSKRRIVGNQTITTTSATMKKAASLTKRDVASAKRSNRVWPAGGSIMGVVCPARSRTERRRRPAVGGASAPELPGAPREHAGLAGRYDREGEPAQRERREHEPEVAQRDVVVLGRVLGQQVDDDPGQ